MSATAVRIPSHHRPRDTVTPPPEKVRTKLCRHFAAGRCSWGSSCNFLHEGKPQQDQQKQQSTPRPESSACSSTATTDRRAQQQKQSRGAVEGGQRGSRKSKGAARQHQLRGSAALPQGAYNEHCVAHGAEEMEEPFVGLVHDSFEHSDLSAPPTPHHSLSHQMNIRVGGTPYAAMVPAGPRGSPGSAMSSTQVSPITPSRTPQVGSANRGTVRYTHNPYSAKQTLCVSRDRRASLPDLTAAEHAMPRVPPPTTDAGFASAAAGMSSGGGMLPSAMMSQPPKPTAAAPEK